MAKSDKFSSKVPALADYTPSFVNEDGEITDAKAVVKLVHNLMTDKAKAQDAREDALAEAVAVAEERDGLQEKLDDKNAPDAQAEIQKANTKAARAEETAKKERDRADRLEVAMEKGLTPAQAKRLQGESKEELEADADEILELFGGKQTKDEESDEDPEDDGFSTPRSDLLKLTNGGDPAQQADRDYDYEKIADQFVGNRAL